MKRVAAALLGIAGIVAAVLLVQYERRDAEYQHLLGAGDEAVRTGDAYAAIERLSGAIALRPDSMAAYFRRAQAYRAQHRRDEAVRDLRAATRLAPDATEPLVALAELANEQNDYASAAEWYGRAEERLQNADPELLYALALARYRAGMPAAAVAPLQQAIASRDPSGQAHHLLGLVYRDTNQPEEAIGMLEETVRLSPSLLPARDELADLYGHLGRPADEIAELEAAAALDPQPRRRIALAFAEAHDGRFDDALATLREAGEPDNSLLQLARGRVYLACAEHTGDPRSLRLALNALVKALPGSTRRSETLALYGRALFRSGNAEAAERRLKEAVSTSPVDVEGYAFLADVEETLMHPVEARNALSALDALEGDTASPGTRAARAARLLRLSHTIK